MPSISRMDGLWECPLKRREKGMSPSFMMRFMNSEMGRFVATGWSMGIEWVKSIDPERMV